MKLLVVTPESITAAQLRAALGGETDPAQAIEDALRTFSGRSRRRLPSP